MFGAVHRNIERNSLIMVDTGELSVVVNVEVAMGLPEESIIVMTLLVSSSI